MSVLSVQDINLNKQCYNAKHFLQNKMKLMYILFTISAVVVKILVRNNSFFSNNWEWHIKI